MITALANAFVALALCQASPPPLDKGLAQRNPIFPEVEDSDLLAASGLSRVAGDEEVVRYVLRRGFGYGTRPSARIVQADWPYGSPRPRGLIVELSKADGAWQVTQRQEAPIEPSKFGRLINNVAAATSALGARSRRGEWVICSHADMSRLDLSIPDERMRVSRGAHCSSDAPAVIAGDILTSAIRESLKLNDR